MFSFQKLQAENIDYRNSIQLKVEGYWSTPITIYVSRTNWMHEGESEWKFEISNSSGGKEGSYDDVKASEYFAKAILACVEYCRELQANIAWLEENYQTNRAAKLREYAEEHKRKQDLIDADPEVGAVEAKKLVKELMDDNSKITEILIHGRGESNWSRSASRAFTRGGSVKGCLSGEKMSRADLIDRIAESSKAKLQVLKRV